MALENDFSLSDALSDALESTIEADSNAATRCCDIIREYAYGYPSSNDSGKFGKLNNNSSSTSLTMAKFTMKSADGKIQEVQIPQITMMPLPLLHVKEASFEFDLNMQVSESNSVELNSQETIENQTDEKNATGSRPTTNPTVGRRPSNPTGARATAEATARIRRRVGSRLTFATETKTKADNASNSEQSSSSQSSTHIKATIKMEQADLPAGIKTLLQAAANSLTIGDSDK